jgi:hypothetical protein
MSYHTDNAGRKLSQDERIERALAKRPKQKQANPPRPLTTDQFLANREAEKHGRAEAAAKFAKPPIKNPYKRQYIELERTAATPDDFRQLRRMKRWAQQWQRENAERVEREAKIAKLQAEPGYQNALTHSDAFLKTVDPDYLAAASNARGYLEASADYSGYFAKVAEIEKEIWAREDAKAQELAGKSAVARAALSEQVEKAEQAAERLRAAEANREPQE